MPYITVKQPPKYYQISLEDILRGEVDVKKYIVPNYTNTKTIFTTNIKSAFLEKFDIQAMTDSLCAFNILHKDLINADKKTLYSSFHIPKHSGGLRKIDAPCPELKNALRQLVEIFKTQMFALYHTSAFAYIEKRSTIDSIKRHQQNESRWFAKFDFSNFFGSTTPEFVYNMLSIIFPFSEIVKTTEGANALKTALSLCFLDGGLPQGTPSSPLITNIMMIPIDHTISNGLRKMPNNYVYTRYADDILISSKYDFDYKGLQEFIVNVLSEFSAPFSIKKEKTRYGSSSGRNWNLGVMLNKDNKITIGHKKKRQFKAMLNNYLCDKNSNISWDLHDIQVLSGLISYYKMIERDYIEYVISHYNQKYSIDIMNAIKKDLKQI